MSSNDLISPVALSGTGGGSNTGLRRLLLCLLKLGAIGFGGGMAVIGLMEKEFVQKRKLVSMEEFLHGAGLSQILGSFAVNQVVFLGYRLFGPAAAVLCACAFLAPSVALVLLLSELYFRYQAIPALQGAVHGLGPVVVALIVTAAYSIGRKVLVSWPSMVIATAALAAGLAHVNSLWILAASAAAGLFAFSMPPPPGQAVSEQKDRANRPFLLAMSGLNTSGGALFTTFFKAGLVFFGGGFALIPVLHERLVTQLGWLTTKQFVDGVAISNLTPGPIAVLATYAGYHVGGTAGALTATAALFAPAIVLMLVLSHQYGRVRNEANVQRALAGVNAAVTGLILSAAFALRSGVYESWRCGVFAILALAALTKLRWPPAIVLSIGAVLGYGGFV